jgi:glycosyltransferase involved in cell wall biosynthesis
MRIDIQILTRNRPTELAILLTSIFNQTYNDFDIFLLDDCSDIPINSHHFINCIINKLKDKGHRVEVLRNNINKGINEGRQQVVDYCMENSMNNFICRLDDDTFLEADYLEKLVEVIDEGYDLASGVTPPMAGSVMERGVEFVSPVINRVVLDKDGRFLINCDDCGHKYTEDVILPTHHFRSCALYKKEIHNKIKYEDTLTLCGFREEEFLSFRMIINGYTMGVHTGAIAWHLMSPGGGDRQNTYAERSLQNQKLLNRFTKKLYAKYGDFIEDYNKKLGIKDTKEKKMCSLNKNSNLIYSKEE